MMYNLAEKLDEYLDEQCTAEHESGFKINNKDQADWAVRKIAIYKSKIDDVKLLAEKRIQQINAWVAKEIEEKQNQINFFESILRPFAEQELSGCKKRSFSLPSGTVGFRKVQPKFTLAGEDISGSNEKLTSWIENNDPDYLVIKKQANWNEFKKTLKVSGGKAITVDGEFLPDVIAQEMPDNFYVKGVDTPHR